MKYSEENLRKYIKQCFEDAFKAENRLYDEKSWSFEWIMIKNNKGILILFWIVWILLIALAVYGFSYIDNDFHIFQQEF